MRTFRLRVLRALSVIGVALLTASLSTPTAWATTGADRFWADQLYTGEFGAPTIFIQDNTYFAFSTNADGIKLPLTTSTDLVHWRAWDGWPPNGTLRTWPRRVDAMARTAGWALYSGGKTSVWAPSIAKVGTQYLDAYVVPIPSSTQRRCITIASSNYLRGPYRDSSTKPIVCSTQPKGSIDPQIFQSPSGRNYLIWKNSGIPGSTPTEIWIRQLNSTGLAFQPGTRAHMLLKTARPWEGNVIEAPAMIHYANRFYLFYSGNIYTTSRYATGYAVCDGPLGPCRRRTTGPLLASGGGVAGPGAATPFVDLQGNLRLAYAAWDAGHVGYPVSDSCLQTAYGCNQRRMHIASLSVVAGGLLRVTAINA